MTCNALSVHRGETEPPGLRVVVSRVELFATGHSCALQKAVGVLWASLRTEETHWYGYGYGCGYVKDGWMDGGWESGACESEWAGCERRRGGGE